jgi:MFS family permease/rhodanese-related sulfurtransferase
MSLIRSLERSLGLGRDPVRIEPEAARLLVDGGALLVDVRKTSDMAVGQPLVGAMRIAPEELGDRVHELDRDVPVLLACTCPAEWTSTRTAHWLRDRGFSAYSVIGGAPGYDAERRTAAGTFPALSEVEDDEAAATLGALRHPRYRTYSIGVLLSLTGTWLASAAFGYVVLLLGGSPATLGLIGFLNTIPNLIWGLPAGALADRHDPRRLLLIFQSLNLLVAATLALMYATDTLTVGWMALLALIGGSLGALSFPATQAILASTVPSEDLDSAVAINSLLLQLARFVGPALAGFLLAQTGPTEVFIVDAASFLGVIVAVALLPAPRAAVGNAAANLGGALREGIVFMFGQRSIAALLGLTFFAGLFGTPPVAFMLPAIARDVLHGGPGTLGALSAAMGLGSLAGSLVLLWLAKRPNKGEPAIAGFFLTAIVVAGVGASGSVPLSIALALVGGFTGVLFVGLSTVVVQSAASDELRARAMAIWAAAFVGVLPFGALITGGLTALLGPGGAVVVDGIAMALGGIAVLAVRPEVRWLGCAALPQACVAATSPEAVAARESGSHPALEPAAAAAGR